MIRIFTHDGYYHADDVFAVAIFKLMLNKFARISDVEIVRTRDKTVLATRDVEQEPVFDVGGVYNPESLSFDHHQLEGTGARDNGIPYSSAGLAWKHFGCAVIKGLEASDSMINSVFETIDKRLISLIDATDCGVTLAHGPIYSVTNVIGAIANQYQRDGNSACSFEKMVDFAMLILESECHNAISVLEAKEKVQSYVDKNLSGNHEVLLIDEPNVNFQKTVINEHPQIKFVVHPKDTEWKVSTIPVESGSFQFRKSINEAWLGLVDEKLSEVSGIPGGIFVHRNGFVGANSTKEGALEMAIKSC
jgi:uncharacterized UPF0160 family protein